MLDILPSPEVGQVMGEGQSRSPRMEEMRASPVERAGMAGALQLHPPPFVSSMDRGKKEGTFKTSHTHTHTHTHTHPFKWSLPEELPSSVPGCSAAKVGLSFSAGALFLLLFFVPLSVTSQLGTARRVQCNSHFWI